MYKFGLEFFNGSITTLATDRFTATNAFTKRKLPSDLRTTSTSAETVFFFFFLIGPGNQSWRCVGCQPGSAMCGGNSHRAAHQKMADEDGADECDFALCAYDGYSAYN